MQNGDVLHTVRVQLEKREWKLIEISLNSLLHVCLLISEDKLVQQWTLWDIDSLFFRQIISNEMKKQKKKWGEVYRTLAVEKLLFFCWWCLVGGLSSFSFSSSFRLRVVDLYFLYVIFYSFFLFSNQRELIFFCLFLSDFLKIK